MDEKCFNLPASFQSWANINKFVSLCVETDMEVQEISHSIATPTSESATACTVQSHLQLTYFQKTWCCLNGWFYQRVKLGGGLSLMLLFVLFKFSFFL